MDGINSRRQVVVADYPPGRKTLDCGWWKVLELAEGTTLLAREEHRRRRQRYTTTKKPWDVTAQNSDRSYARWQWRFDQASLWTPSEARH